jgi:2-polyprenyl-3-methyl-5-hydroxy-6-metoxy-1,4-benzoquinol methylase
MMDQIRLAPQTPHGENLAIYSAGSRDLTVQARMAAALPLLMEEAPSAVLDVGCGRGELLRQIPPVVRRCGVDCLGVGDAPPDIEYVQRDIAEGLPLDDAQFDAVFAGEVIEHLLDTVGFLRECRRVLRPGGVLILTTPNLAYWRNLLQWIRQQQFFFVDHRADENGHVRYFAPRTLQAVLVEAGFRVERLFSVGDLPISQNALLRGVGRLVGRFFPMRNLSLIAKARRHDEREALRHGCGHTLQNLPERRNSP